jgi:lipoprotein-anchoring transpeptidase ErfK/SrfK
VKRGNIMEENAKTKVSKKAIITTTVSIIAVLLLGIGIGAATKILMERNNNKVVTSAQANKEETNDEKQKQQKEQEKLEEEKRKQEEEEAKRLEEEAKLKEEEEQKLKEEEEKAKAEEEAKKQEENKTEEEKKAEEEKKKQQQQQQQAAPANNGYPYYIKVNYVANVVTVYGKDANGNYTVPVKAMICSTGASTGIYNNGTYKTLGKARWGQLIGPVWGQYCTRVFGGVLFHSVPYLKQNDNSTLEYWEYDRLGENRSLGCIRLTVADAKWLYNNCPVGTSVQFYGSSDPGPLGKPSAQKVTSAGEPYRGWDPTDPDPKNPWHTKAAKEAEEAAKKAAAEKKAAEEAAKKAEEEAKKKAEEEAAKKKAEEEAKKKEEEEANKVSVPNVIGKTEAQAQKLLKDFTVIVEYNEKATKDDGLVSYQSITSSSKVAKGTKITIKVNKVKTNTNTNTTKPTNTTNSTNKTGGNNTNSTNTAKSNKTKN